MIEWINVNDKLPKEGKEVLIYDVDCVRTGAFYKDTDMGDYWLGDYGGNDDPQNIEYWMPLPKKPSKKGQKK